MMKTEDLYGVLEMLCSGKSQYINGSTIIIDKWLLIVKIEKIYNRYKLGAKLYGNNA